jgi:FAD synthase
MEYQLPFIQKADSMLELNQQLQEKSTKFLNRVKDNLTNKGVINIGVNPNVDTKSSILSKKLESFYDYDFRSFISELQKQKIKLSLVQQDEWEEYFNTYKTEINQLQAEIEKTDKEIDQMVYELYELAEDEIAIVENSIKQ